MRQTVMHPNAESIYDLRDEGYEYAKARTRQGRTVYIDLENPTGDAFDDGEIRSGVWGQASIETDRGWWIDIDDIEDIEGVKI